MTVDAQPGAGTPGNGQDAESDPRMLVEELAQRLRTAEAADQQADTLTDRIAGLELQMIEADLRAPGNLAGLSPDDAATIGEALVHQARLREALDVFGPSAPRDADTRNLVPRLQEARDALRLWLEAPSGSESKVAAHGARVLLLIATIAAFWGAWTYHPAVLALLIPVAAPIGLLLNRGDDKMWRRLGAKQRFSRTRVTPPPKDWDLESVATRRDALEAELVAAERAEARRREAEARRGQATTESFGELSLQLVEVEQSLAARATRAGLDMDRLDDAARDAIMQAGEDASARTELKALSRERTRLITESSNLRDFVWRTLNQRGAAVKGTSTRLDDLRSGLDALAGAQQHR